MTDTAPAPANIGGMAGLSFQRSGNGWLFAAPFTVPRRTYLVTDQQRDALIKPMQRIWQAQMAAIIITVIVMGELPSGTSVIVQGLILAGAILVTIMLGFAYANKTIRPVLADAPLSTARLNRWNTLAAQAAVLKRWQIIVSMVLSLGFVALGLLVGFDDGWDWASAASVLFFGVLGAYGILLLFYKGRAG